MIILKAECSITKTQIEGLEKDLSEKLGDKVCIIPYGLDIVEITEELKIKDDLLKDIVEIEAEQSESKTDIAINISVKTDEKSFEEFKRKLTELSCENKFEVVTKDKFIEEYICGWGGDINFIKEYWNEISKGYNFVIKAGENYYYSVDKFNKMIGE